MDALVNFDEFAKLFSVQFGVPTAEQWPLFVLSKWALVILPFYAIRYFNTAADWAAYRGPAHAIPGFWKTRQVLEKFIAHSMFYIGMGIPIIGIDAVLDVPRLVGFTLTNMLIHEVLPIVLSKERFRRFSPEWRRTLGVNLIIDNISLEFIVYRTWRGEIIVQESPHARLRNFIKRTRFYETAEGVVVEVLLRPFFVPEGKDARFFVHVDRSRKYATTREALGRYFRIDFGDLADYAMPVYINDHGRQHWLWRSQYWTKFFNEVGGRSYASTPFEIIRKFFLVVLGTPLSFSAGNILVHFQYGETINLHPLLYFNFGIIFAFTIGGMYGASIFSTLIELSFWAGHVIARKYKKITDFVLTPSRWRRSWNTRDFNPYYDPATFGALLENQSKTYGRFRFLVGGIVMGGVCSWGLTYFQGQSWDHAIQSTVQSTIIDTVSNRVPAERTPVPGIYREHDFITVSRDYHDRNNQLFLSLPHELAAFHLGGPR